MVSQSAQFAPFSHDYVYANDTTDKWEVFNPSISRPNNYRYTLFFNIHDQLLTIYLGPSLKGICCVSHNMFLRPIVPHHIFESHRQQAVSGLTQLPSNIFEGSGQEFHTFGVPWFPSPLCVFSLGLYRLRIFCKSKVTLRWVYHLANGWSADDQDGCECSRT